MKNIIIIFCSAFITIAIVIAAIALDIGTMLEIYFPVLEKGGGITVIATICFMFTTIVSVSVFRMVDTEDKNTENNEPMKKSKESNQL